MRAMGAGGQAAAPGVSAQGLDPLARDSGIPSDTYVDQVYQGLLGQTLRSVTVCSYADDLGDVFAVACTIDHAEGLVALTHATARGNFHGPGQPEPIIFDQGESDHRAVLPASVVRGIAG